MATASSPASTTAAPSAPIQTAPSPWTVRVVCVRLVKGSVPAIGEFGLNQLLNSTIAGTDILRCVAAFGRKPPSKKRVRRFIEPPVRRNQKLNPQLPKISLPLFVSVVFYIRSEVPQEPGQRTTPRELSAARCPSFCRQT